MFLDLPPTASAADVELSALSSSFEERSASEILHWAVERFAPRLAMATAFGAEGCVLIHLLAEVRDRTGKLPYLFNLETGYQFRETLETRDHLMERYGLEIHLVGARETTQELEARFGGPLYATDPNQCCHLRKIEPLTEVLSHHDAWISAIRREQTRDRARAGIVERDRRFGLVKVNPLANWTKRDVWTFILDHDIPYNPLHDQGYPSIGCWPCTRPVGATDDDRAGRWSGHAKTECGLHTLKP
ncbi:MAG TPA: phosphoadenylyl-sulfate reductase [Armatimonadota bacterium]|jgi:phosphoadenosine phosphosulfate reductase